MGYVSYLENKTDKSGALQEYWQSSITFVNESWQQKHNSDSNVSLYGSEMFKSRKRKGEGLVVHVNKFTVKERLCSPDTDLSAVRFCSYYLQKEFNYLILLATNITPNIADDSARVIGSVFAGPQTACGHR